jgi:oxalate decarboxylase
MGVRRTQRHPGVFEAGKGDVIFAPQGHYHYFENASATEELVALIVFNSDATEPKDGIGEE